MHLLRVLGGAAAILAVAAIGPAAMAARTPDQPAVLQLVRGGGGGHGGGHSGGFHGGGYGGGYGGYAAGPGWGYHPWAYGYGVGGYPYGYACPYPYYGSPYCTLSN